MTLNKNTLAIAVAGALLFAGNANAQVTLTTAGSTTPVTVATEAFGTADTDGAATFLNPGVALNIVSAFGYAFSAGEVRYARVECPSHVKFATATVTTDAHVSNLLGAVNGVGTNAIYFSVTAGATPVIATNVFTVAGNRIISNGGAATCSYGLYDQPSQAQAGGSTGRIAYTSGAYIAFASGYLFATSGNQTLTADVEANAAFTRFTSAGPVSAILGRLSAMRHDVRAGNQIDEDGLDITLADIFGATTAIGITGDFTFAANANGTYTGAAALNRVFLSSSDTCSPISYAATSVSATGASFTIGNAARDAGADVYLCVAPNTTTAIPSGSYTASLNAVVNDATEYNVSSTTGLAAGSITRNGTSLQAPLAQVPDSFLSRMALTNTGSAARPYTISVMGETGNTIGTANLTGNVPANGTVVIDLKDVMTSFTGKTRGTLNVTVAAPSSQIQGLYQIVSQSSGAISNHVMVRPGSN